MTVELGFRLNPLSKKNSMQEKIQKIEKEKQSSNQEEKTILQIVIK